jgi:diguanylate cyclase (GGDEF)-like protein
MNLVQLDIYIYAILIMLFLAYDSKNRLPLTVPKTRIFRIQIYLALFLLVFELLSWFVDGRSGSLFIFLNYFTNSFLYLLSLLPLSLWFAYLDESILRDPKKRSHRKKYYYGFNLMMIFLSIVNFFTGILFRINTDNRYERTYGIHYVFALNVFLFFVYLLYLYPYRKFISGRIYQIILLLGILPFGGGLLQGLFYGVTLTWPSLSLIVLAGYILIEREETQRDRVTGLATRSLLESRIHYMMQRHEAFYLIMVDMDYFKEINDTYGHDEGDIALATVANLLSKSIKHTDTAYRYGGDEFMLLIETKETKNLEQIQLRLDHNLSRVNETSTKPYRLSFSYGSSYYDGRSEASIHSLVKAADEAMYENKLRKKSGNLKS